MIVKIVGSGLKLTFVPVLSLFPICWIGVDGAATELLEVHLALARDFELEPLADRR